MLRVVLVGIFTVCCAQLAKAQELPRLDSDVKNAFIIICDTSPGKTIVLDENGKWLHRVKELDIRLESNTLMMKCVMYEGPYKPSAPEIKSWRLSQVKSVSEQEFQTMINALQTDYDAVKRLIQSSAISEKQPISDSQIKTVQSTTNLLDGSKK